MFFEEFEFGVVNKERWLTNATQTHTILADQVIEILIIKKRNTKQTFYYLQCIYISPTGERRITLARYANKHLIIQEKNRLIKWLDNNKDVTEFKCFPEKITQKNITAKQFYL